MPCYWRARTSRGRILLFDKHNGPPTLSAGTYPSCAGSGAERQFGYPIPLTGGDGFYSIWCLFNDEGILSVEPFDCDAPEADQKYDCLNGGCIPTTTYNTPGYFDSLAACQSGCAKNSDCTGECVSKAEIAALQQAANNLQSRLCQ